MISNRPPPYPHQKRIDFGPAKQNLVAAWAPFLGARAPILLADYSGRNRNLTTGAGTASYIATPGGLGMRMGTDACSLGSLSGHGITKTFTLLQVLYRNEGSASNANWPAFRDTRFMRDGPFNFSCVILQNTQKMYWQIYSGATYVNLAGATNVGSNYKYEVLVMAWKLDQKAGAASLYVNGVLDGSASITMDNSVSGQSLTFDNVGGFSGEWTPYSVLARYLWSDAKPDAFIKQISRDWDAPFRSRDPRSWVFGGGSAATSPQVFDASGTFVAQTTSVYLAGRGGGGGGADGGVSLGGAGGGGGAYSYKVQTGLTIGNSYSVVVPAAAIHGADGGDAYFIDTSTYLAKGGKADGTGGAAGACVGDAKFSGGAGGARGTTAGGGGGEGGNSTSAGNAGSAGSGGAGGAGGTGGDGGDGGAGGNTASVGVAGTAPGGAGGGGGTSSNGGAGAAGRLTISWPVTWPFPFGDDTRFARTQRIVRTDSELPVAPATSPPAVAYGWDAAPVRPRRAAVARAADDGLVPGSYPVTAALPYVHTDPAIPTKAKAARAVDETPTPSNYSVTAALPAGWEPNQAYPKRAIPSRAADESSTPDSYPVYVVLPAGWEPSVTYPTKARTAFAEPTQLFTSVPPPPTLTPLGWEPTVTYPTKAKTAKAEPSPLLPTIPPPPLIPFGWEAVLSIPPRAKTVRAEESPLILSAPPPSVPPAGWEPTYAVPSKPRTPRAEPSPPAFPIAPPPPTPPGGWEPAPSRLLRRPTVTADSTQLFFPIISTPGVSGIRPATWTAWVSPEWGGTPPIVSDGWNSGAGP